MKTILNRALWLAVWVGSNLGALAAAEWKPADGPLMTRWAKDVSPKKVHREYPRPQLARSEWQNLNGLWDYAISAEATTKPAKFDGQILVPFPVESALSGVMQRLDEKSTLWYRRSFEVPKKWNGKRVRLNFEAVDWKATVWVNGREVGSHQGGYDAFSFDVTDALKPEGAQEVVVVVMDPTEGDQPRGKQVRTPKGIWYTPSSGIWQTVWLEPVAATSVAGLKLTPDVDARVLRLQVSANGGGDGLRVEAVARAKGREVGRVEGAVNGELSLPVSLLRLWSPDDPFLYDLRVRLKEGDRVVDEVTSYFGMRKVSVGKDEKGVNRILLNGKFVFQVGTLDQGFWPDGLHTAPSDEALKYDIEMLKRLGFNMTRKHIKVEPARWYYWCDKLGLLVWQDMPSGDNKTAEGRKEFESELDRMLEQRHNFPCIVTWVVFNEGWGQYDTERLTEHVKAADPSRIVNNASGWTDMHVGDLSDMHKYPGPGVPPTEEKRVAVLGEFGGLGLAVTNHTWSRQSWGYQGMADSARLTRKYVELLARAWSLQEDSGLSAVVYTQTTDVETECNGLLTYDRALLKLDAKQATAANRGLVRLSSPKVIAANAQQDRVVWRYTFDTPAAEWWKAEFDASGWKQGRGGFGTRETPGAIVKTEWKTDDIWLRREFVLPEGKVTAPRLQMHHDEDVEVYLNGVLATKQTGFTSDYTDFDIDEAAAATLKPGKNIMAVHCHQTQGGQYIDVGIVSAGTDLAAGKPKP